MKLRPTNMLRAALPVLLIGGSLTLLSARMQTDIITTEDPECFFREAAAGCADQDTVPGNRTEKVKEINLGDMKLNDLEKIQTDLDKQMLKLEKELSAKNWQQEQEKLQKELADVNFDKALKEVELSLAKLKEEGFEKELKLELEKARKDIERSKKQMKFDAPDFGQIEKELQRAKLEMQKGKKEMKELENMLRDMKADGLIDENADYDIEYKNGDLYINGKQQSKEVTDKYRKYFKDDPVRIRRYKKAPVSV